MRKSLVIGLLSAVCSFSTWAVDGTVHFQGAITDQACEIDGDSGTDFTVQLGKYGTNEFKNAGATTVPKKFSLKLKNCPQTVTQAAVRFGGTPDGSDDVLKLADGSTAKKVGVQLYNNDSSKLPLGVDSASYTINEGNNSLDFKAAYIATAVPVEPGSANADATFSINYN